jgi:Protein of unknown function (DUF1553)/Protein of unknown function (DUF1549)
MISNMSFCPLPYLVGLLLLGMPATGGQDWWSFQPVHRPAVPDGTTHPVDGLIRQGQLKLGLTPSPEADRATLIRRLSFDLRGLPPGPTEIDAFQSDSRPDAYERLVDAFLASPSYGIRWATPWLDLARYADSAGFEEDARRPNAWRYRDWVVDALNADMPYDRFVGLQLAADELAPDEPRHKAALGFLRCGPSVGNERGEKVRMDELDDIVTTTSSAFLGLTIGCARCHDHKSDPIPTEDYYRLVAVFAPARFAEIPLATDAEVAGVRVASGPIDEAQDAARVEALAITRPARERLERVRVAALPDEWRRAVEAGRLRSLSRPDQAAIEARLAVSDADIEATLSTSDRSKLAECRARIERLEASRPPRPADAPGVLESSPRAAPVHVLIRGDVARKASVVRAGPPRVLNGGRVDDFNDSIVGTSSRRRAALANWITDPKNPLTARVEVNRIWQGHFGTGLVRTPSDFGATGDPPALPELLDWLASEFVARGWSRKAIHRLIVTSATYRQSSRVQDEAKRLDPEETLHWRYPLRRLDAEVIRDAMLWCAGTLNDRQGGPGVFPPIDPRVVRSGNIPRWPLDARDGPDVWRRSLYLFRMRSVPIPLLESLDAPDRAQSCPSRSRTTVPTQALTLLNSPFVIEQSRRFAARVAREAGPNPEAQIKLAFRLATGKAPSTGQIQMALDYLAGAGELAGLCHALFNSNAFLYLD